MSNLTKVREALEKITEGAPTWEDFSVGGKYDYDNDCGNSGDIADKAAAEEHLTHSGHAQRALSALSAHEEYVRELVYNARIALAALRDADRNMTADYLEAAMAKFEEQK